jgi:hypothetical protein
LAATTNQTTSRLKSILIITILLFLEHAAHAQKINNSKYADFSNKWKSDSLGNTSFRSKSLRYNPRTKEISSVNGINLVKYTKTQITELLGNPNRIIVNDTGFTFDYFLAPYCGFAEQGCPKWVLEISFKSDIVQKFYSSFIEL